MHAKLFETLGQIAGIGGIALGVFLLLFREVIRKKIFPKLTRQQSYRIILAFMILTWSVAISGIVAWMLSRPAGTGEAEASVLTASLWTVDLDTKGSLVGSHEIAPLPAGGPSSAALDSLVGWIALELGVTGVERPEPVKVTVHIPADLESDDLSVVRLPPGPVQALVWGTGGGGKIRVPLDRYALMSQNRECRIELRVPGFEPGIVKAMPGQALDSTVELEASRISIGVESFEGTGAGVADRLSERLSLQPGFRVVSPEMLATIREEVRAHNARLSEQPMIQMAIRKLGVDYIVSGSLRTTATTGD